MSFYTYEAENVTTALETYEWDNTWIEQANRQDVPRVLYIGDSISCGIRRIATERSEGRWLFDGFGSSKAVDHPCFFESLRLFAVQQNRRDAILINNGLHGWHLTDGSEYGAYYGRLLDRLSKAYPETPLYVVLTTAVEDTAREARVVERNRVARELAAERGLAVIDLHAASVRIGQLHTDGVHFSKEGYAVLADAILRVL